MPDSYDDSKYGVIFRKWFGLTAKHGGDGAILTFNESESTVVTRWYPKGPIKILKLGVLTAATLGKGEEAFHLNRNSSTLAAVVASTASEPYTIASTNFVGKNVDAGSYLTLIASTNVCSTGSCAAFVEYVARYHQTKWSARKQ